MSPTLQVWSDFFDELDEETRARQELVKRLQAASTDQYDVFVTNWLEYLRQSQAQKDSLPPEVQTLIPSLVDKQFSLQSCLTQALCILDEAKQNQSASAFNTQFGDFGTLLGLLEEANSHLHALMVE